MPWQNDTRTIYQADMPTSRSMGCIQESSNKGNMQQANCQGHSNWGMDTSRSAPEASSAYAQQYESNGPADLWGMLEGGPFGLFAPQKKTKLWFF